jgi:outer membrane immunogenic protein
MKRYLIAAIATAPALVLSSQLTLAADMPVKAPPPPPPPPSWTGFYIGAHVGGGWSQSGAWTFTDPNGVIGPTTLINQTTSPGVVGGFQAGFNWQFAPAWVFGIEGDFSGTTIHDNRVVNGLVFGGTPNFPNTQVLMHTDTPDLASIRGRIGYVGWENIMFYATGGAAWEREHFNGTEQNLPPTFAANFQSQPDGHTTSTGWVAGAGVEAMINGHFMVRAEYLYYGFNSGTTTLLANLRPNPGAFPLPFAFNWAGQNVQVARVGFGYKF